MKYRENRNSINDTRGGEWWSNQDKNYIQSFPKLCTIERISLCFDRERSFRVFRGNQKYKTTEKGLNLLKMHNEMGELLQTKVKYN